MTKTLAIILIVSVGTFIWMNCQQAEESGSPPEEPDMKAAVSSSGSSDVSPMREPIVAEVVRHDLATHIRELAQRKLREEGGIKRSEIRLEEMRQSLLQNDAQPPFAIEYEALKEVSRVALPTEEVLWELSFVGMEDAGGIIGSHSNWLQDNDLSSDNLDWKTIREDTHRRGLRMPPEAVVIGLTGGSWMSIEESTPSLVISLGRIRESSISRFANIETEIWKMETSVYQAAVGAGVDFSELEGTIRQELAKYYPPLEQALSDLGAVEREYLEDISHELRASGHEVLGR